MVMNCLVWICLFVVLHVWNSGGELVFSPKRARFAQARIAESSPWCCSSISLRRPKLVLSDALSRSGENGSPKWVLEESQCTLLASSFRRGVLYFWANDNLAQASWTRPGELDSPKRGLAECHCSRPRLGEKA